jgi:probable F420-dependent oxidoreductase
MSATDPHQYPYTPDGAFPMPGEDPVLDVMTLLSYVASHTKRVKIGTTVIIVPYRNPLLQAKMFASLDVLTAGRVICGVGVGWLQKEFEVLGVPYEDRGPLTSEYLEIFKCLWTQDRPEFSGRFYSFDGILFYPKPVQKPHIPIWVGGHSRPAVRRAAVHGDAWHPTRQTPEYVADMLPYLHSQAQKAGRDPDEITISLKRSIHFTDPGFPEDGGMRSGAAVVATTREVVADIVHCRELGIEQLTYDFRTAGLDLCIRTMEHLVTEVIPAVEETP